MDIRHWFWFCINFQLSGSIIGSLIFRRRSCPKKNLYKLLRSSSFPPEIKNKPNHLTWNQKETKPPSPRIPNMKKHILKAKPQGWTCRKTCFFWVHDDPGLSHFSWKEWFFELLWSSFWQVIIWKFCIWAGQKWLGVLKLHDSSRLL